MSNARRRKVKSSAPENQVATPGQSTSSSSCGPMAVRSALQHALPILAALIGTILLFYIWNGPRGVGDLALQESMAHEAYTSPFFVADVPGKGKGLLASRDIQQGERLLCEKPLFVVPRQISSSPSAFIAGSLAKLGRDEQEAFFNLSYVNLPQHLDPDEHQDEVKLAIFQTNAVAAGDGVGIFPKMARINHGCSSAFNAVYTWREKEGTLCVHALKAIGRGEELLTSYMDSKRSRHHRRAFLAEHYGFECQCSVCSLPLEDSRASDKRLEAILEAYQRLASWEQGRISGTDAIAHARRIWQLGEEEGYWSERGRLAADAAWVAAAHSEAAEVAEWAQIAAQWYTYEVGVDSEQVAEMQQVALQPERHRAWGTRPKYTV